MGRRIVENTISVGFNDLDARLARIGSSAATQFDAKSAEVRCFHKGRLDVKRAAALSDAMRAAGLPL